MIESSALLPRIAVAKLAGLLIGLTGFVLVPLFMPDADPFMRWGVLFWYPTMGAVIAMVEVIDVAGALPWHVAWWIRGPLVGGWMNFVVTLVAHESMGEFLDGALGPEHMLATPFLFVAEGLIAGGLIAYLVMRFGGEGRAIGDD